ncbi:hypothetical protein BDR26DRAFT_862147 [Obelidium mucronatum]|nr:hypothetical protein BDR26DRAFT_862147 [Obelidium mucronatum]
MSKNHLQEHILEEEEWEYWEGFNFNRSERSETENVNHEAEGLVSSPSILHQSDEFKHSSQSPPLPTLESNQQQQQKQKQNRDQDQHRTCRICFCSEDSEDDDGNQEPLDNDPAIDLGRLISPCKCKGSMKYVHLSCLNEWRKVTANNNSFFKCDQCNYEYHFERTKWAHVLRNNLLITFLAILTFSTLVLFAGFLAKFFIWAFLRGSIAELMQISADDLEDDFDVLVHRFLTDETLLSWYHVNWVHLTAGLALVGLLGASSSVAGVGLYRVTAMRRAVRVQNDGLGGALTVVTIIIGCLKALWWVYNSSRMVCMKSLEMMEQRILDIDEDVEDAKI